MGILVHRRLLGVAAAMMLLISLLENPVCDAASERVQNFRRDLKAKKAEEIISQKVAVYHELTVYIESEELSKTSLDKDIAKAVQLPAYLDNIDKIKESVVMMELMAGIEMPAADNATKQKLTLEMLQDKFSQTISEKDKFKGLIIAFINNLKAKKLSAAETKLWKRAQTAMTGLSKNLP